MSASDPENEYKEEEPDSPEEALAIMVGRLHPQKNVQEYLTILRHGEVAPASKMKSMGEVLREANNPSVKTMVMLGVDPVKMYKLRKFVGIQMTRYIDGTKLVEKQEQIWQDKEVTAQEYTREMIKRNRGFAQALVLLSISQKLDNYRVAREGTGRMGGIRIAQSMITGKQEVAGGFLQRFRRALGTKNQ